MNKVYYHHNKVRQGYALHPQTGGLLIFPWGNMEYRKPPKSVKDQAKLLEARGLKVNDVAMVEHQGHMPTLMRN